MGLTERDEELATLAAQKLGCLESRLSCRLQSLDLGGDLGGKADSMAQDSALLT